MPSSPKSPASLDLTIARAIRALREARGLSQAKLGEAIGVTFQQVQKYERGANRISSSRLQRIADTLNVPVSTFFTDAGNGVDEPLSESALTIAVQYENLDERDRTAVRALIDALSQPGRGRPDSQE
ncbi:helix-turn-helix domain-containing protein [Enterovirga rhinocerotis]|uniref:Transcriptional regulator with XRE-family HTH domain n=1 Tax=Enterovirga rhinocerotis TaxID=1339210 RepID=A0A4R7BL63_9HYPH|nr:transcriptional regulator with XRE-family HTH domain [Enterovirga rhinocerotis]